MITLCVDCGGSNVGFYVLFLVNMANTKEIYGGVVMVEIQCSVCACIPIQPLLYG